MGSYIAATNANPTNLEDDGLDADLAGELPIPETRQKRGDAHMDKKVLKELWYKAIPKLDNARRKRTRLIPEDEFQYTRLGKGQIRLISLEPHKVGSPGSPLYARVFTRPLVEVRGRYEAISYTWGDQSLRPKEVINLRNANPSSLPKPEKFTAHMIVAAAMRLKFHRFPIYENLHEALMRLRSGVKSIILWIDAICIDQSERGDEEKRQQLMMMDDIYKSAANVCVWIGGGFVGSTEGMQLARDITNFQTFDKLMASGSAERRWPDLIKLLKSPWFSRRWVIQEIALAREATIHCGRDRIHWDDFTETISLLLNRIGLLRKSFRDEIFEDVETSSGFVLVTMLDTVCRKSDKGDVNAKMCDLETLVSTLLGFQATHPKDAIFSVLSLARDPPQPGEEWERKLHGEQLKRLDKNNATPRREATATNPTANAIESADSSMFFKYQLSTRDVFIAFVTRSIYNSGCLDLICRHWAPPVLDRYGKEVQMPSWVSPLVRSPYGLAGTFKGRQNSDNLVANSPDDQRKRYGAAGSSKAVIAIEDDQSPQFQAAHPYVRKTLKPAFIVTDFSAVTHSPSVVASPSFEVSGSMSPNIIHSSQPSIEPSVRPAAGSDLSVQATVANGVGAVTNAFTSTLPASPQSLSNRPVPSASIDTPQKPPAVTRLASFSGRPRRSSILQPQAMVQPLDIERAHHLSGVLAAEGFVVGRVSDMSDVMRGGIVPGRWVRDLGWRDDEDSNRVPELLWRTLVADRNPRGGNPPPWYRRACLHALHDPRKTDIEGNLHTVTPPDRDISEHSSLYLRRVESVVWNRRLFRVDLPGANMNATRGLKDTLFGVGPSGTDCGDMLCILLGCSVPVILKEGDRKGVSRIMGEAYVHGIMDGEAMQPGATYQRFLLE